MSSRYEAGRSPNGTAPSGLAHVGAALQLRPVQSRGLRSINQVDRGIGGRKDHINIRILQIMISGIPLKSGPWNQNVRSLCLCGLLGP